MNATRAIFALLVLAATTACGEANKQTYTQAAIGSVAAVAMVGVYRAATHDCWALCRPGYLCNREAGLCELGECQPRCEYGTHCVRDVRGYRCMDDANNQPIVSSTSSSPLPVSSPAPPFGTGLLFDAGTADAASSSDASLDAAEATP